MNQCPVVFFSFKDTDGLTFESAYGMLCMKLAFAFQDYQFLLDDDAISDDDKGIFKRILGRTASIDETKSCFLLLTRMLEIHFKKSAVVILDEYDVPIAKASSNGYYSQMLDVMRAMMSTTLKDNTSLDFAVITGCLKIAKESIFTGTNNFVSDTILSPRLSESFGFTQADVDQMLKDADLESQSAEIKTWYDGYHFGDADIYCPWDVISYLRDFQYGVAQKPKSYWKNTSDNAIIRSFIDYAGDNITTKLETLMAGGFIVQHIEENLTYDYLHSSEENLWSVLYLTGYLTKVRDKDLTDSLPDGCSALMIPNAEIREIFETTVSKWFDDSAKAWNRSPLFDAVWSGNSEALTKEMTKLLRMTISYHDYREDFYHAFLAGIFTGAGYVVESNKEHGEGRSDVIVKDIRNGRVAIFEAKYAKLWMLCRMPVILLFSRSMTGCTQQTSGMTMMTSSAMASHSSKSVVWYAKNKHYTGGPHNMCDVLDKVENRGIAKGKAEGEDTLALLMKKLFDQNRIEDAKRASEDKEYRARLMKEFGIS